MLNRVRKDLKNYPLHAKLYSQVSDLVTVTMEQRQYLPMDLVKALPSTFAETHEHVHNVLSFAHIEVFSIGAATKMEVIALAKQIPVLLACSPLPKKSFVPARVRMVKNNQIAVVNAASGDSNCAVDISYQLGTVSDRSVALLAVLSTLMDESAFYVLRTEKQLGYVVKVREGIHMNVLTLEVIVQSSSYSPDEVLREIMLFVKE